MDLKMGLDNDLLFENGECPVTQERAEVVAQRLLIRFRTFKGEWFLDVLYGPPYLQRILGHKVKKSVVDAIMHEEIRKERGVSEITYFSSSLDRANRKYQCQFRVRADNGQETELITI